MSRADWVALVVNCACGRRWSPPVRLSAPVLQRMLDDGLAGVTVLATTRCRHCGRIHAHQLAHMTGGS